MSGIRVKQKIFWIIGVCVTSLVGLLICQTIWIKRATLLADEQYGHRVVFALGTLSEEYTRLAQQAVDSEDDTLAKRSVIATDNIIDRVLLDSLLKHYIQGNKLSSDYEYSIIQVIDSTTSATSSEASAGYYRVPIKPAYRNGDKASVYQLQLTFPDKISRVASEMWHWLVFSVVFILSVALSLAYIIRSVIRQKQRSVEQSDFINSMIHELKTPIATIGMSSKVLKEAGKTVTNFDKLRTYAEIVDEENKRSMACVESLLQMLTVNKRSLTLNREWIDVNAVITTTIESFSVRRSVKFNLQLDERVKNIFADKMHIRGVLDNLIDNAVKYSAAEGCEVSVRTEWEGSNVIIIIEDNGKGMTPKDVKRIFDKFYRSANVKKRGIKGFGLGLYYVKQVVEAHGGRVFVKSILNKGTNIGVILPIERQNI